MENHGIVFLNFCGNPVYCPDQSCLNISRMLNEIVCPLGLRIYNCFPLMFVLSFCRLFSCYFFNFFAYYCRLLITFASILDPY